ncbi:MAG: alpha/beta hydrolase [Erysipelotrichaceae bacterium]|nr:alpha/beta hydrolase [Erysipelotrichaceae bacterium]
MKRTDLLQAVYDFWRPNRYGLKAFLINDGQKHPFAIICPGGAYGMVCSFMEGRPYAEALNRIGCHAFVVYYRVGKKARYPRPQEDLRQAIEDVMARAEEWNLDTDSWSLWGSSAGGHLAASYCVEDRGPKPTALILTYPVVTMGEHTRVGSRKNLLGKDADQDMIDRLSVERHITTDYPPVYVWNGTIDRIVEPVNSRMLEEALERTGVPHLAEEFEGVGHGVGLAKGTDAEVWFEHAIGFWKNRMSH